MFLKSSLRNISAGRDDKHITLGLMVQAKATHHEAESSLKFSKTTASTEKNDNYVTTRYSQFILINYVLIYLLLINIDSAGERRNQAL